MAENTEKSKAKELVSIAVDLFPEVEGQRVYTDKRCKDGKHKFTLSIPVPETDDVAKELFNRALAVFTAKGVRQAAYDLSKIDEHIHTKVADGADPNDMVDEVREIAESEMFVEEKAKKTAKTTLVKELERKTGREINTQADMDAVIQGIKDGSISV